MMTIEMNFVEKLIQVACLFYWKDFIVIKLFWHCIVEKTNIKVFLNKRGYYSKLYGIAITIYGQCFAYFLCFVY